MMQHQKPVKAPFDYQRKGPNASVLTEDDQFERADGDVAEIQYEEDKNEEEQEEERYIEDFYGNKSDGPQTLEKQHVPQRPHKSQG